MQIKCPQCGAGIEALTETRFYRCPFCTSSFVLQGGTGLLQYTFSHSRDDRLAWSSLNDFLTAHGVYSDVERVGCDLAILPFWLFTLANGSRRLVPAIALDWPELTAVTLPAGDLEFLPADVEFVPPTVLSAEAEEKLGAGPPQGQSLVYLPLYLLAYRSGGAAYRAVVSAIDRKVYGFHSPAAAEATLPAHHVVMVGGFALLLLLEGLLLRQLLWRGVAFIVSFAVAYPLYYAMLRKEL